MGDGQGDRAGHELGARCAPIELLIADVDGVLTDGVIAIDGAGDEIKRFHVRDGLGYALWHRAGKHSAILSGRRAAAVERRAAELSIAHVLQGHDAKAGPFLDLVGRLDLEPRQVCYIGDDLPDLPVLRAVGLAACPADAVGEVRAAAHLVTLAPGGRGAVREVIEVILKSQGKWESLVEPGAVISRS
jgi:3-deoxy-D-manno-octulosonate 8-phosphate phosphatase (KDO 8-P phosphatase)